MKKTAIIMLCMVLICLTACHKAPPEVESTSAPAPVYYEDVNGDLVPAFEGVDASSLDAKLFREDENGRMVYDDDSVELLTGIDVSVFQGDINWEKVADDGIDFVILRCGGRGYGSKGEMYEDSKFEENYKDAVAAGLDVGAYFFSQAISTDEAVEEAKFVLDIIKDKELAFPVVFDWEHMDNEDARTNEINGEQVTQFANAFCETIRQAGFEPMIYLNCEFGYFKYDIAAVKDIDFWFAEYSEKPSYYYNYKIWQYSKNGNVAGIDGSVDMNVAIKDIAVG